MMYLPEKHNTNQGSPVTFELNFRIFFEIKFPDIKLLD